MATRGHETCDFSCEYCDNCMAKERAEEEANEHEFFHHELVLQESHIDKYNCYLENANLNFILEDDLNDDDIPF